MADILPESSEMSRPRASVTSARYADCGIAGCHPQLFRRLANPKVFLINFAIIATMRSAYFVHMTSVMTTLEKRYAFPGKLSGLIMIADNISGMIVAPVIGYLGTKFNRPKLIGIGTVMVGLSSIISGLPYLIYGPGTHLLTGANSTRSSLKTISTSAKYDVCDSLTQVCTEEGNHNFQAGAYALLWIGSFVNGLGNTAIWTIGVPYIDDNVRRKNSPIYLSLTTVVRYSGVMLGFLIASFSLRFYEDPTLDINLPRNDPRWVGAWWIGFFIIGVLIILTAIPMFMFPITLKGEVNHKKDKKMSFKDACQTFKRVITNPVLVFDTIGSAFRVIGWAGYYITKTRYLEAQFRQSASSSSFLTGTTSSVMKVIGILAGGFTIAKFKPRPKVLLTYIVTVDMFCNLFILTGFFVGCPQPTFGNMDLNNPESSLWNTCNKDCTCSKSVFQPVCAADGVTNYFNPCFAGCRTTIRNGTQTRFTDCSCLGNSTDYLTNGYCPTECGSLFIYLTVISLGGIVSATTWTGNFLIALRAVDQQDKSFAMGLIGSFMSIFAYIPYPILFSFVADFSCMIWEESCGKTGNCWLYDLTKFRHYLHGTSFALLMIGSFFDMGVLLYAKRLDHMYDDDEPEENQEMTQKGEENEEEVTLFDAAYEKRNSEKETIKT